MYATPGAIQKYERLKDVLEDATGWPYSIACFEVRRVACRSAVHHVFVQVPISWFIGVHILMLCRKWVGARWWGA